MSFLSAIIESPIPFVAAAAATYAITSATATMVFGKPAFDFQKDCPSLAGRVILVTGGNTGLGYESIFQLTKKGAKVYMASRTESKALAAIEKLKAAVPNADIHYIPLDLTSFASIQSAAKSFLAQEPALNILLNNAGVMAEPYSKTADGFEMQFGTNHMGHFLLTQLLLPALLKPESARIVNVASLGHNAAFRGLPFDQLAEGELANTFERYGVSKLSNILHAKELDRRYPSITAVSVHPGVILSGLYDAFEAANPVNKAMMAVMKKVWWTTEKEGALNQLYCATQQNVQSGAYYLPVGCVGKAWNIGGPSRFARDAKLAQQLWDFSLKEVEKRGIEVDKGVVAGN